MPDGSPPAVESNDETWAEAEMPSADAHSLLSVPCSDSARLAARDSSVEDPPPRRWRRCCFFELRWRDEVRSEVRDR